MFKALIVDDEGIERRGLSMLIRRLDLPFETKDAPNGADALSLLQQEHFDVLLTDIRMPFMDGIQLAHEARQLFPDLYIIIFSAYADFRKAQQAMKENVGRYLLKPVDVMEFSQVMRDAEDRIRKGRAEADRLTMLEQEILAFRRRDPGAVPVHHAGPAPLPEDARTMAPAVEAVLEIIRKEYSTPLGLNDIAERVYLNPSYLSTLFRREVGKSFVRYLNDYRLERAAEALLADNRPVGEIRKAVGFSGDSYFIALFRERYGCTPQQYRTMPVHREVDMP